MMSIAQTAFEAFESGEAFFLARGSGIFRRGKKFSRKKQNPFRKEWQDTKQLGQDDAPTPPIPPAPEPPRGDTPYAEEVTPRPYVPPQPRRDDTPVSSAEATVYEAAQTSAGELVAVLACVEGALKGEIYRVHDGSNTMGRNVASDIHLGHVSISREHAELICKSGVFLIKPLKDENPTFVGDQLVTGSEELHHGALIRLGTATFELLVLHGG